MAVAVDQGLDQGLRNGHAVLAAGPSLGSSFTPVSHPQLPNRQMLVRGVRGFCTGRVLLSAHGAAPRTSVLDILAKHQAGEKIAVVTAHDYLSGQMADDAESDIVLVGDSLAMVALGYEDTTELPFEEFLYHCKAVSRGVSHALLVADLPFGTYESSTEKAIESAIEVIRKGRANAVKLEGGVEIAATVRALTQIGIPVMGHVGLTPQRANSFGGFKVQGKTVESAKKIIEDALSVQEAGAFSIVIEAVPSPLGELITNRLTIPTIGIGAGPKTSGQVLVQADLLGLTKGQLPKFVKKYFQGHAELTSAVMTYVKEVKASSFPEARHTYKIKDEVWDEIKETLE